MSSVNKVIVLGNLGNDPEIRYTKDGQAIASLSVATNERWKNKNTGQNEERTEWHRVSVFGRQAEICRDYLAKGRTVYVEGRLQTRKWEDKEGQTRYTTEIVAQAIKFIGGGANRGDSQYQPKQDSNSGPNPASQNQGPPQFDAEDDIPF